MNNTLIKKIKNNDNKNLIKDNNQAISNDNINSINFKNNIKEKTMKNFRSYFFEKKNSKINKEIQSYKNRNKYFKYDNDNISINIEAFDKNNNNS